MKRSFLFALLLVGCGGGSFSTLETETDGGGAGAPSSGGSTATARGGSTAATGGAADVSGDGGPGGSGGSGGSVGEENDAGAAGGATAAGGSVGGGHAGSSSGGSSSTGGTTGTGGTTACTLVTHSNGTGQTWQDCAPLGTYNEAEAMAACKAYCAVNNGCVCMDGPKGGQCGSNISIGDNVQTDTQVPLPQNPTQMTTGGRVWVWQGDNVGNTTQYAIFVSLCTVSGSWN